MSKSSTKNKSSAKVADLTTWFKAKPASTSKPDHKEASNADPILTEYSTNTSLSIESHIEAKKGTEAQDKPTVTESAWQEGVEAEAGLVHESGGEAKGCGINDEGDQLAESDAEDQKAISAVAVGTGAGRVELKKRKVDENMEKPGPTKTKKGAKTFAVSQDHMKKMLRGEEVTGWPHNQAAIQVNAMGAIATYKSAQAMFALAEAVRFRTAQIKHNVPVKSEQHMSIKSEDVDMSDVEQVEVIE